MSLRHDLLRSRVPAFDAHAAPSMGDLLAGEDDDEEVLAEEARDTIGSEVGVPGRPARRLRKADGLDYSPLSASSSFDEALEVSVASLHGAFRVYYTPPIVRDASSLSPFDPNYVDDDQGSSGTVFVCHHGAGLSGLSWARFAEQVRQSTSGDAGILALDARGHGRTMLSDDTDFSLSRLADDLVRLLKTMYPDRVKAPAFVLVGHSLGGAVVAEACGRVQSEVGDVTGLAMLDIVEGTAIEALDQAKRYIENMPRGFASKEDAIRWHMESRTNRTLDVARVSVPGVLKANDNSSEVAPVAALSAGATVMPPPLAPSASTSSAEVKPSPFPPPDPFPPSSREFPYIWQRDLRTMGPYWEGWFKGLSGKFLEAKTAKLLILAGTDRLDKEMTIAQMQGKFQLSVFPDVGHLVQEDNPAKTATTVVDFWRRNENAGDILKRVKKVGAP